MKLQQILLLSAFSLHLGSVHGAENHNRPRGHILAPNDFVEIKVRQEDELETKARVESDGTVQFPLIGAVSLSGKSLDQAAALITELLGKDYIFDPQVSVRILENAPRRFTVIGQVEKPGSYVIPDSESIDLLGAIGMAGGYTRLAKLDRVLVRRQIKGKDVVLEVDARSMQKRQDSKPFIVQPADVITIDERFF